MSVAVVFETHSLSEDNEHGIATGWLDGRLSDRGRVLAGELRERHRRRPPDAVFASDLGRADVATKWALDVRVGQSPLEELVEAPFEWREGWGYAL